MEAGLQSYHAYTYEYFEEFGLLNFEHTLDVHIRRHLQVAMSPSTPPKELRRKHYAFNKPVHGGAIVHQTEIRPFRPTKSERQPRVVQTLSD